jgi:hypothetical protein
MRRTVVKQGLKKKKETITIDERERERERGAMHEKNKNSVLCTRYGMYGRISG